MELCRRRHNSKERRLEPQITIGLLTDASGFPLMVEAFEGNEAETATMLPVINAFKTAHQLSDVTVVADAGMISEANQIAIAGSGVVVHPRAPGSRDCPTWSANGATTTPTRTIPDGQVLTQPWPATSREKARGIPDRVIYYQYRHDRARRTLRGIDEQVAKAERAVDGKAPVKRNRYIQLTGATKIVNRDLEAKTRALGRVEGLHHQPHQSDPQFVIDAYHQLWRIEKSFRMSKHDLQARPIYHHKRESIEAHLTHRVRRPGRQPLDRTPNRLEHQKIRPHRTPLPHRPDASREADADRRGPATRGPPRSHRQNQHRPCALNCPKSGR